MTATDKRAGRIECVVCGADVHPQSGHALCCPSSYGQGFFGRPRIAMVDHQPVPTVVAGWSLGGLTPRDRVRLARHVMEDPRRGDTGMKFGPHPEARQCPNSPDGAHHRDENDGVPLCSHCGLALR